MKFTVLSLILFSIWPTVRAQEQRFDLPTKPVNCEYDIAMLEAAAGQAGETGLVIVIARLGDGERKQQLNYRRLHNVLIYLTQWGQHRKPDTVVTAVGERVKGYGRVYVAGKLSSVTLIRRNADLIVGSCTYEINSPSEQRRENNLYPWLDRYQRVVPRRKRVS